MVGGSSVPTRVIVRQVEDRRGLLAFLRFPWRIYAHDPNWVPPLIAERLDRLNPDKDPFGAQGQYRLFLAYKDGELAGTVAAFVNPQHNAYLGEEMGAFGFFEAIDDQEVADRLLDAACGAVANWGMKGIRGPTTDSFFDAPGVLVEPTDCPPVMLEAHTPLYYRDLLERYGFEKWRDTFAWRVDLQQLGTNLERLPPQLLRVLDAAREKQRVRIRKLRFDEWDREVEQTCRLFNATLNHLPEFAPIELSAFRRFADQLRPLIDPDMALFAEVDGRTVGYLVAIPDVNQILKHLNGRLYPIGWFKFWWYRRRVRVVSFKLLGVLPRYRRRGIDTLMYMEALRAAVAKGYRWLDGSLSSENNPTVQRLAQRLGAERYKHYRLYQRFFES